MCKKFRRRLIQTFAQTRYTNPMTTLSDRTFADFRFAADSARPHGERVPVERCHQYVPYMELSEKTLPKFMDITNNEKRVYLKEERVMGLKTAEGAASLDHVYKSFDSKKFLDLGVAPLQRIINEMKSISAEGADDHYDQKAAKASGLQNYCEFLQGSASAGMPRHLVSRTHKH